MDTNPHELAPLARLGPAAGTVIVLLGVWIGESWWFWVLATLAFAGAAFGVHPVDLLYNEIIAPILGKKPLARCPSRRYALMVAGMWLVMTGFAFNNGPTLGGGILGGVMAATTFVMASLEACLPCTVFNAVFRERPPAAVTVRDDDPTALLPVATRPSS